MRFTLRILLPALLALSLLLVAGTVPASAQTDNDHDGWYTPDDCNDSDPAVHPGADDSNCDNIDNDCDGSADEHYVPTATSCGQGVCLATGWMVCVGGATQNTCTPGAQTGTDNDCDGLDDNCNGATDENYVPTLTNCGQGVCAAVGQLICVGGATQNTCIPGPTTGTDNDCDGLDDNCNGAGDENYVPTPTSCGQGVCAAAGQMICVGGALLNTCIPGPTTGTDNDCDGLDNNCNGATDENYVPNTTNCGQGVCAAVGQLICVGGATQNTCTPGTPSAEICDDGLDNDCDGLTDGADPDCYSSPIPVGGIGELPPMAGIGGSPSHNYAVAATLALAALLALTAGAWYARRRLSRG